MSFRGFYGWLTYHTKAIASVESNLNNLSFSLMMISPLWATITDQVLGPAEWSWRPFMVIIIKNMPHFGLEVAAHLHVETIIVWPLGARYSTYGHTQSTLTFSIHSAPKERTFRH